MTKLADLDICFLAGTLGQGGAERQLFYLLHALKNNGATVRLLSLTKGEFWEDKISNLGIPVTWVGKSSSRLMRLRAIARELQRTRPSIVQSQHSYTNLYAVLAARSTGALDIGAIRNDGIREIQELGPLLGPLSRRLPRVIAANSQLGRQNLIARGVDPSRIHLLRNVVDTDYFSPARSQNNGVVRIATVGRLAPQKRFDRFLRALATATLQIPFPVQAILAGIGPLGPQLESQANELGLLNGTLKFVGAIPDTREIYRQADLLVLSSDWEGTPNVVLEAMSCEVPVLATRVGDVPELISDGETGLLVDPADEGLFAEKLHELITNAALRRQLAAQARQFVVANYSFIQLPSILRQFYGQCASSDRR